MSSCFFLQVDAHGAVTSNNLVGANAGVGRNVSVGIWNADVGGNILHRMVGALDGGGDQAAREFLMPDGRYRLGAGVTP
jgi:hypothetical protein